MEEIGHVGCGGANTYQKNLSAGKINGSIFMSLHHSFVYCSAYEGLNNFMFAKNLHSFRNAVMQQDMRKNFFCWSISKSCLRV